MVEEDPKIGSQITVEVDVHASMFTSETSEDDKKDEEEKKITGQIIEI